MDFNKEKYIKALESKKPEKGINTYGQSIVKEICDWFGSYKEFGRWCGVEKRIGVAELKAKFDYIKSRGIKSSHYLAVITKK